MTIDFVLIPATDSHPSDMTVSSTFFFIPSQVRNLLAIAASSGFDAILVDDAGGPLANVDIAANVANWNAQLDVILTHWADVTSPAVAASDFASLDRLAGGRLALRILGGEAAADGFLASWQRTGEYLTLLKRLWSSNRPIDHEGPFYSLRGALVADKGLRGHEIPIRMSGNTGTEIDVAARHATVFELPQSHPDQFAEQTGRVATAAARHGRSDRISFSARFHASADDEGGRLAWFSACLSVGITGFMVSGLKDAAAIERFGAEVITPIRSTRDNPGRTAPVPSPSASRRDRFSRSALPQAARPEP